MRGFKIAFVLAPDGALALAGAAEELANIDFTAELAETYATAEMKIALAGRIEFDVTKRRAVGTKYKGSVTVSAKGSSLKGTGTAEGGSVFTDAKPAADSDDK